MSCIALEYEVVPLNARLSRHTQAVTRALENGRPMYPDPSRPDFYDVELDNGRAYIHVRDAARIVYVVALIES